MIKVEKAEDPQSLTFVLNDLVFENNKFFNTEVGNSNKVYKVFGLKPISIRFKEL